MTPEIAALAALVGYLCGAVHFSRIVSRIVAPQADTSEVDVSVPGTDKTYKFTASGATTVAFKLGSRVGCAIGFLDMLKVAVPTLVFKLLYPAQPYELIVALAGMVGHNWPVFHRFKGGRGISAYYGGLFAIDWLGAIVTSTVGMLFGLLVIREFLVAYLSGLWLLIPWMWFRTHRLEYLAYAILVNVLFLLAMIPDLRQYLKLRRETTVDLSVVMDTIPMGREMLKMQDRLLSLFKRKGAA